MKSRTLTKNKFNAIRNELLNTDRPQADIAADYQVSTSSVSTVNNEASWQNHLAHKNGRTSLRKRRAADLKSQTRQEQAKQAGLHPHTREERSTGTTTNHFGAIHGVPVDARKPMGEVLLDRVRKVEAEAINSNRALLVVAAVLSTAVVILALTK